MFSCVNFGFMKSNVKLSGLRINCNMFDKYQIFLYFLTSKYRRSQQIHWSDWLAFYFINFPHFLHFTALCKDIKFTFDLPHSWQKRLCQIASIAINRIGGYPTIYSCQPDKAFAISHTTVEANNIINIGKSVFLVFPLMRFNSNVKTPTAAQVSNMAFNILI